SAPVKIASQQSEADRLFLARHDSDPFSRWEALQGVAMSLMLGAIGDRPWSAESLDAFADALADTVASPALDPAFKALALGLPTEQLVARTLGTNVDPDRIRQIRMQLLREIVA